MKKRIIIISILLILCSFLFTACENNKEVIGIIGAMEVEIESLKEEAKISKTTTIADMEFNEGIINGKKVVIVQSGMGKVNAGLCAYILINNFNCQKIINTGVAGSLDNRINIGDIVVSIDAVQHDYDVSYLGFDKGEIPYTGLYAFKADEELRKEAINAIKEAAPEINYFEGRICSGDQFISTKSQKDIIINNFGGLCCEMEGGAIAQVCYLNNIPFIIIRAISDKPDETEVVDYNVFEKEAAKRSASIVSYMIKNMK